MQIDIQTHHIELTDSMRDYVHTKFEKLVRFFEPINHARVILRVEKLSQIAEATLLINQGEVQASAEDDNMYAAIDALVDKLTRQLNKHKEKLSSH